MTMTCRRCNNDLGSVVETELEHWYDNALVGVRFAHEDVPGARRVPRLLALTGPDGFALIPEDGDLPPAVDPMLRSGSFTMTYRPALVALGQAFDTAVREGMVTRNVVRLARRPRQRKRVGRDLEHWQPAELLTFRSTADRDPLAAAWRLTLCGLTRADVMGLRWSDVDLEAGTVTVRTGRVALDHGYHVDEPKSAQRRRRVPVETIHPGTVAALRSLRVAQAADRLKAGEVWAESGLVVVDALGAPLRPETYSDRFRRLCATAGVSKITLHSVRHSLAFWLHSLGVTPADAAALLGHTVEVHLSTYLPESGATGIAAAAAALGRVTGTEVITKIN
jgi:integrase